MKRLFLYLILLLIAVIGAVIARYNAADVTFDFYFSSIDIPLVALLYIAIVIGALLGIIVSLGMILRARREASRLRKRLAVCEQEVKNLREIPIKGQY